MSGYRTTKRVMDSLSNLIVRRSCCRRLQAPNQSVNHQQQQQFTRCFSNNLNAKKKASTTSSNQFSVRSLIAALKPRFRFGNGNTRHIHVDATNRVSHVLRTTTSSSSSNNILGVVLLVSFSVSLVSLVREEGEEVVPYTLVGLVKQEEVVPYTKRLHLVSSLHEIEKEIGESKFEQEKKRYGDKVLPQDHPQSVRVSLILESIVEALHRGINQETVWGDDEKGSCDSEGKYIDGLDWEVVVVDSNVKNASCYAGGKIILHTGMLKHLTSDAEIATVIGHEVAHVIARHSSEKLIWKLITYCVNIVLGLVVVEIVGCSATAVVPAIFCCVMSDICIKVPRWRRMETEADYIGLLLMASAGYDPRVAPKVRENPWLMWSRRYGTITSPSDTHPHPLKRAQFLAQPQIMGEALAIYNRAPEP